MARSRTSGQGRPKGTPNKITADVRAALLRSFKSVGSAKYLVALAKANPRAYAALLAKCIPQAVEMTGKDGEPLQGTTVIGGVTPAQLRDLVRDALEKV